MRLLALLAADSLGSLRARVATSNAPTRGRCCTWLAVFWTLPVFGALVGLFPVSAEALITVGSLDVPGAKDVEVVDGLAYVAGGVGFAPGSPPTLIYPSLQVVEVSNPAEPTVLSVLEIPGAIDVEVVDGLAYVVGDALHVIDVSNPAAPVELGTLGTPDAEDVEVVDGLAYVVGDALRVIDVSNPAAPVELGSLGTPDAEDVEVVDGLAYVADGTSGLRVIDVSNPAAPIEIAALDTPGYAVDVEVVDGLAYLADRVVFLPGPSGIPSYVGPASLRVIDVSNPAAPVELGAVGTFLGLAVEVVGGLAYVAGDALRVIDVSDPAAPVERNALFAPQTDRVVDVKLVDGLAYVASSKGVRMIDVSNVDFPRVVGEFADTAGFATDVEVTGGLAYVAGHDPGLRVIDVSNPAALLELSALDSFDAPSDLEVVDGLAYVADGSSGLRVIDVSSPAAPLELGVFDTPGEASEVEVVDGLAYVADGSSGLRVIDVSNPAAPLELGSLDTPADASEVEVVGGLAYVMDDFPRSFPPEQVPSSLRVIDVSNPDVPVELGVLPHPRVRDRGDVAVVGALAYVASSSGLRVIDVSNPAAPFELGALETFRGATDVEVVDGLAYVASWSGLRVIDVSNPAAPFELGAFYAYSIRCCDVEVVNGLAYASGSPFYLRIIDFGPEYAGTLSVGIDIDPWSQHKWIDPFSRLVIPVALLGSETLDLADVDVATLAFGPEEAPPAFDLTKPWVFFLSHWDVNGDGKKDLLAHFQTEETGIAVGDTEACLTGDTLAGAPFEGCDAIRTGPLCGRGFEAALVLPPFVWLYGRRKRRRA